MPKQESYTIMQVQGWVEAFKTNHVRLFCGMIYLIQIVQFQIYLHCALQKERQICIDVFQSTHPTRKSRSQLTSTQSTFGASNLSKKVEGHG